MEFQADYGARSSSLFWVNDFSLEFELNCGFLVQSAYLESPSGGGKYDLIN